MVSIRLSRVGKKNQPLFRIVVQDKKKDPYGPALDVVGFYNPHTDPATIELKKEKIQEWLKKGAQPTNTVWNLLVNAGIVEGKKRKVVRITKERGAKIAEAKAAAEAEKAPKPEEPKPEEKKPEEKPAAPKEEPKK